MYVELESDLDFSRLVCALEHVPRISLVHQYLGRQIMSTQMDILSERLVVYYAPVQKIGRYISYGIKQGREEAKVVNSASDTSKMYSPMVLARSLPQGLKPGNVNGNLYSRMELEDLDSLAKLSCDLSSDSYPLFLFPSGDRWILGVFMSFGEDSDDAYFCYVALDEDPKKPFLRHSAHNNSPPSFVDSPADHGYSYVKIIRLRSTHPLIDDAKICN